MTSGISETCKTNNKQNSTILMLNDPTYLKIFMAFIGMIITFAICCGIYYGCNAGMSHSARGQQTRRFALSSLMVWIPLAIIGIRPNLPVGMAAATGVAWAATYPLLYHLTNRRKSPDYENYGEIACGIYIFGLAAAVGMIGGGMIVAVAEWALLMVSLSLAVYYRLYGTCIDANGMKILQDSHPNEIIEFARSYSWWKVALLLVAIVALLAGVVMMNIRSGVALEPWRIAVAALAALVFAWYMFKPRRGMFQRSGIVRLWLDIKEYSANDKRYVTEMERRLKDLNVRPLGKPFGKPSTIMMVIGESASRDYMSAFTKMDHDTTPWMRGMAEDKEHCVLFPNSYSCAMHTVQSLEKALTEYNQYNGRQFYDSCSVIDIAHKLGYRVHWYSNQGHLGANDTPITLVANTAEVAKWTKQDLGKVQYDESLIDFLDELDPAENNFLVLHLKGSHFNFLNRYPADRTVWGEQGVQDNVLNFENSLRYTDDVLRQFYEYASKRLNLQAMVYFSDHATIPDRHRSPNFAGFGDVRIPLFVCFTDEYMACHPDRIEALKANKDAFFTNDLAYELMCGIFDVESNHFDESSSLASKTYRYTRDDLTTYEGKARIADDK